MLKKDITLFGIFTIAAGSMISSGIFILPGLAFDIAGPAVFVSYFLAGMLALVGVLSVIELATAMPRAGGDFFFVNKTFGPLLGTLTGFLGWTALSLKSAFAIYGLSEVIYNYTEISHVVSGLVFAALFVSINIAGVREATIVQTSLVFGLLTLLVIFVGFGVPAIDSGRYLPFAPQGYQGVLFATGFVFVTFGGLIQVANVSEEVSNPKRNIPLGIISSVIAVSLIYTLVTFVVTGTLDADYFKGSLTPVADAAENFMGHAGYIIITIASVLAFTSTANAGIMASARYPMALSRDHLLPERISSVNQRFKTPVIAILITGGIIVVSLLLPLDILVKAASSVVMAAFVLTNLAVIVLRESKLTNYRPSFKVPLYPLFQIASIVLFLVLIADLGIESIEIVLGLVVTALAVYYFYGRKRQKKDYALLHLLERITDWDKTEDELEDELRDMLYDRENIEKGLLHQLVQDATVVDMDREVDFEQLLGRISDAASDKTGIGQEKVRRKIAEDKKAPDRCISDFTAIFDLMFKDDIPMFLIMVRSRKGIRFSRSRDHVKAVFLLGGCEKDRIAQLRILVDITQLVQEKDFRDKWMKCEKPAECKNILTLDKKQA